MLGKRLHRTVPSAGLMSVLALLALACLPVLAHASSIPEYTDSPPTAVGGSGGSGGSSGGSNAEPPARNSSTQGGGASAPSSAGGNNSVSGSSANKPSSKSGAHANTGSGGGTGQQGSPAAGGPGNKVGTAQQAAQTGAPNPSQSDDGGSSPLIPILIAIAILAATSLGVVLYRQRRQRGTAGDSLSPKAS
jgi:cobalamin biosynthesis Mg chelatase CobN